ncbi:MAG: aspartate carbamoyltransferase catalytic subunit [Chlorobium sp.]|uniref:aspartate carbamoyltransferase catalytic subunit n=1 Tax=Chlorobium sp. TaxID=1095 RepID=UPI0025BB46B0|nr:aspartate carbamoyltransferase catalytic subunit [Chlorobium sp.]MCF8216288.1 aspartate carbamoyltransferase catalytic subunit [Chlorobium sp.]MCF8271190.1 aspartate carbamoyltransferase catalytic subunit [Chlorobium sp.]MCF8287546.1 aspartate carbamoyltransferase catalytic subunit [Chlorobium sp.]MCF8291103.1 aspartate carbamoyltransferase catalytic subunit [Chlorobium sp.]MCF8385180.1 aspartate carbamoyltransferase catalytic subunit [Chlorobium sp.]
MKNLTGLCGIPAGDITGLLDLTAGFKSKLVTPDPVFPALLQNRRIALVFFENSTRTRFSFEIAARHLGANTLTFTSSGSSVSKGETLSDTIRNLEAMKVDAFILRHASSGAAEFITGITNKSVINAGDGAHEHPTQALLDMFTLREHFGSLADLKVVILGDVLHSRVARSNIFGLQTLGAQVALCSPATLIPPDAACLGVKLFTDLDQAIAWADAAIVLRLQLERTTGGYLPSLEEYSAHFGLNDERLDKIRKHLLVLHPGPINREIEISNNVADRIQPPGYSKSMLLEQVTNGVAVRMAVLQTLLA